MRLLNYGRLSSWLCRYDRGRRCSRSWLRCSFNRSWIRSWLVGWRHVNCGYCGRLMCCRWGYASCFFLSLVQTRDVCTELPRAFKRSATSAALRNFRNIFAVCDAPNAVVTTCVRRANDDLCAITRCSMVHLRLTVVENDGVTRPSMARS